MTTFNLQIVAELVDRVSAAANKIRGSLSGIRSETSSLGTESQKSDKALGNTAKRLKEIGSAAVIARGGIIGLGIAAVGVFTGLARQQVEIENNFNKIAKAADLPLDKTDRRAQKLLRGMLDMAAQVPEPLEKIADVMADIMKAGIGEIGPGDFDVKALQEMTEMFISAHKTFNIALNQTPQRMAHLANIFGKDLNTKEGRAWLRDLMDTIAFIDKKSSASADNILNFLTRGAPDLKRFGFNEKDIIALGTLFEEIGKPAEQSVRTFSSGLARVRQLAFKDTKRAEAVAQILGYESSQAFHKDIFEGKSGLESLFKLMQKLQEVGPQRAEAFITQGMGLQGARSLGAILDPKMLEILKRILDDMAQEDRTGTLLRERQRDVQSLAGEWQKTVNFIQYTFAGGPISQAISEFLKTFLRGLRDTLAYLDDFARKLTEWYNSIKQTIMNVIETFRQWHERISNILTQIVETFNSWKDSVVSLVNQVVSPFTTLRDTIVGAFDAILKKFQEFKQGWETTKKGFSDWFFTPPQVKPPPWPWQKSSASGSGDFRSMVQPAVFRAPSGSSYGSGITSVGGTTPGGLKAGRDGSTFFGRVGKASFSPGGGFGGGGSIEGDDTGAYSTGGGGGTGSSGGGGGTSGGGSAISSLLTGTSSGGSAVKQLQQKVAGIRKLPIKQGLQNALDFAAKQAGVDEVRVTSGGQTEAGPRTGSRRHNTEFPTIGAADVDLISGGRKLSINRPEDQAKIAAFTKAFSSVAPGAGVGVGQNYMGPTRFHFGGPDVRGGKLTGPVAYSGPSWFRKAHAEGVKQFGSPETQKAFQAFMSGRTAQAAQAAAAAGAKGVPGLGISQRGIDMIKGFEGSKDQGWDVRQFSGPYGVKRGANERLTLEEAERRMKGEISMIEGRMGKAFKKPLTQNQHDALVSFFYNLGTGKGRLNKIAGMVNSGNAAAVPGYMRQFTHAGGRQLRGLVRRRNQEAALFGQPGPLVGAARQAAQGQAQGQYAPHTSTYNTPVNLRMNVANNQRAAQLAGNAVSNKVKQALNNSLNDGVHGYANR